MSNRLSKEQFMALPEELKALVAELFGYSTQRPDDELMLMIHKPSGEFIVFALSCPACMIEAANEWVEENDVQHWSSEHEKTNEIKH